MIERVLPRAGAEMCTAADVESAARILRGWRPGCVISDIGMPGQDGYGFIREIRALPPPLGKAPAIARTASARESDRARALAAGFDDHLVKPVDAAGPLQKVASAAGRA